MITVVGSFVMDMVARMERFPQAGETMIGQSVQYFPGGKGANQCVAAARLGGKVQMVGMLGRDAYVSSSVIFSRRMVSAMAMYLTAIFQRLWPRYRSIARDRTALW